MSENLSETDLNNKFFNSSDSEADLTETTEELEDNTTVDDDEELEEGEEGSEDQGGPFLYDGEEITDEVLKGWKLAHDNRKHQQADYTKKGQAASDKMKLATSEFDKFQGLNSSLQESVDALESMLNEEENSINWDELAEDDAGEAIKLQRKLERKRSDLESAKKKVAQAKEQAKATKMQEQGNLLRELLPEWFEPSGKTSVTYKKDTDSILEYLDAKGYPADYANTITTAREWQQLLDASKHHTLQKKKPGIKKKVIKTKSAEVKGRKPKQSKLNEMSAADANSLFYG